MHLPMYSVKGSHSEEGWNAQITKDGDLISQDSISMPVYKTGAGGTLRAFVRESVTYTTKEMRNASMDHSEGL